jgi:hypothetical protein
MRPLRGISCLGHFAFRFPPLFVITQPYAAAAFGFSSD